MRINRALFYVIILFILFHFITFKVFSDWARWRGPEANGISTETEWNPEALSKGPRIVWKANVGIGYSCVAIKGSSLYTMGNRKGQDVVYCLDAMTGRIVWKYSYPCAPGQYHGPYVTPTVDGSVVYTLSKQGHLFCFSADKGKVLWQRNIVQDFNVRSPSWGFSGSPVVEGELLILNAGVSGLALNKRTGNKVWISKPGVGGYATPVIYDYKGNRYAAIFAQRAIYGVDVKTGKEAWSYPWITRNNVNAADPVVFENKVFISSNYGAGCALLDISDHKPKLIWKNYKINSHFSAFILIDGYIYGNDGVAGSNRGVFRCLDIETGKEMWKKDLGFGSLIAADGKLILFNEKGNLFIVKATPSSYQEISSAQGVLSRTCWTPPVLCEGMIYCRNNRGDLVCIDVGK